MEWFLIGGVVLGLSACALLQFRAFEIRRTRLAIADKVGNLLQVIVAEVHGTECEQAVLEHCLAVTVILSTAFPSEYLVCPVRRRKPEWIK